MMLRKSRALVADFETTTLPDDCRVWAWAMADVSPDPVVTYGTELDDFMEIVSRETLTVWFHNLKFDGSFVLDWLFRHGYTHTDERYPRAGEFTSLISSMGMFYQIQIRGYRGHLLTLKDSLKKIPMKVSEVAQAFDLDEGKGEIDYTAHRPRGYQPTLEEWDYIRRDVEIIAKAMHVRLQDGSKLTVGADALTDYKQLFGKKLFDKYFPVLPPDLDKTIRAAYRGGFTYVSPRFQGKHVGAGSVYDVNSLYPYIMTHRQLPYGLPKIFTGAPPPDAPLFIVSVTFTARLKRKHIPTIQIKNSFMFSPTQYQTRIDEPTTMVVTNVDLALMSDHYHMEILSFNGGLAFRAMDGFFNEYVDKWMKVKETTTGGKRAIAKLFLNSLYGKFATNPDVTPKIPIFEDDRVKLVKGKEETREPVYTAVGVFITAWARDKTIRSAQQNFDRFIYADTDSLHLTGYDEPNGVDVHPTHLGAWDHEYDFVDGVFLRAKQYGEELADGSTVIHVAGLPDNLSRGMTLDKLQQGSTFNGKLIPLRVPGGIVLQETTFTIT